MQTFGEHRERILSVLPHVEVILSGSALLDDVPHDDVDLVALVSDVPDAAGRLRRVYPVLFEEQWHDDWAAFRVAGPPQVDIVLTRRGTKGEAHHRIAWDVIAADPELVDEYRSMKATPGNYAERKAAFFARVVARIPT
jgi:hypothetical protein